MRKKGTIRRIFESLFGSPDMRSVDAGSNGPRWQKRPLFRPANAVHAHRATAEARANQMVLNNPFVAAIVRALCNILGDGPAIRPTAKDPAIRDQLIAISNTLYDQCDEDGQTNLAGLLERAMRSLVLSGEIFIQMLVDLDTGHLKLRLLAPLQFSHSFNQKLANGGRINQGIEFDASGRRVAYHVTVNPDGDSLYSTKTVRIDAKDVLHAFEPIFPGQQRGISMIAPSATRIDALDAYEDSQLAKARTEALFGLVFTKPDDTSTNPLSAAASQDLAMEPGATLIAPPGHDVRTISPTSSGGQTDFMRGQLRAICSGAGVPYELVSGDLSQVNYSSARVGLLEFRRRAVALQKNLFVARLLQPIWRRALLLEALAGRLDMQLARTAQAEFTFPGWQQLDPLKETKADLEAIRGNLKSRHEVIAERGRDPADVDAEIQSDPIPAKTLKGAA